MVLLLRKREREGKWATTVSLSFHIRTVPSSSFFPGTQVPPGRAGPQGHSREMAIDGFTELRFLFFIFIFFLSSLLFLLVCVRVRMGSGWSLESLR